MAHDILALFDLDHTLLPNDSDEQWVEFLLARGKLDRATFEAANLELGERYRRGEAGAIEFTEFYLSTLKPFTAEELDGACTATFMRERILPSIAPAARATHRQASRARPFHDPDDGDQPLSDRAHRARAGLRESHRDRAGDEAGPLHRAASSVRPTCAKARSSVCWRGLPRATCGSPTFRESWFYSDSQNDLPLLSHVTHPVAVNADPVLAAHARHKGWPQIVIG